MRLVTLKDKGAKMAPLSFNVGATITLTHIRCKLYTGLDRLQYCCNDYTRLLQSRKILISMTEMGDPYENAIAERVNGILKSEFKLNLSFRSFEEAMHFVKKAIWAYNELRSHSSCNYLTPAQAHTKQEYLPSKWNKKKERHHAG